MAAASLVREATPPPVIGKAGRYTVFITPPATPKTSEPSRSYSPSPSPSPRNVAPVPPAAKDLAAAPAAPPAKEVATAPAPPPPVQVPPQQFEKPSPKGSGSAFGFFWDAVAKVQDVHSSLDEYLAGWFGLNQSKYQWALNDYYETSGGGKNGGKSKELASKGQSV